MRIGSLPVVIDTISILGVRNKLVKIITFVMRWALLDNVNENNG